MIAVPTIVLQAQNGLHNNYYFLKLDKVRLASLLQRVTEEQQKEDSLVKRLLFKNDSLVLAGNIYDSVSADIKVRLNSHSFRIDSLNTIIANHNKKLASFNSFRSGYRQLQREIPLLSNYSISNTGINEYLLKRINNQLDSSNLSGEKGRLKGILNSASAQQEKEAAKIGQIGNKKDDLLTTGVVDSSVAVKIDNRMQLYQRRMDSISGEIKTLQQKLNTPKDFTRDFTLIKKKIILIDSVVNKNASAREFIFKMIDDGLSKSTRNLFKLAAFFGPGGFIIPQAKYNMARKYFSPVIDSLVKFSNNYNSVFRTATIIVNGYADGSAISKNSTLYKTISAYLQNANPVKEELNAGLSALRAEEISKYLMKILEERYPDFTSIDKIVFESVEAGKGEIHPDPAIGNYRVNDDRRRVVIIFWSILPIQ